MFQMTQRTGQTLEESEGPVMFLVRGVAGTPWTGTRKSYGRSAEYEALEQWFVLTVSPHSTFQFTF